MRVPVLWQASWLAGDDRSADGVKIPGAGTIHWAAPPEPPAETKRTTGLPVKPHPSDGAAWQEFNRLLSAPAGAGDFALPAPDVAAQAGPE